MTQDEFLEWYRYHRAFYPGLDSWLSKLGRGSESVSAQEILRAWRTALRDVELADAKAASEAMARGDFEEPRSFGAHPKAIRKACLGSRSDRQRVAGRNREQRYINGEPVYDCAECLDDGALTVWHPKSMAAMREGRFGGPLTRYSCLVACTCRAAGRWRKVLAFDPSRMVRCEYHPTPADEEALRQFVDGETAGVGKDFDPSEW